ncbi:MAG: putative rane protein [Clostridia bacterium]|nr:putative rane protein [Clostridia bacterium]
MKENLKNGMLRGSRLFVGLFLYAVGIVMTINANLGLGPWDVFHQGLSKTIGITMGQASISMGIIIVVMNYFVGEKLGWGTLSNMLFIGIFMDILMLNNLIPIYENTILQIFMMLGGMFVIGLASYFYIGAGLGSGPRDGLMVLLTKKTGKSVRFIRNCIEITVLIVGYFLGGFVGVGTIVIALGMGYFVQFAFKLFKFDVKAVKHRYVEDDIRFLKGLFVKPTNE